MNVWGVYQIQVASCVTGKSTAGRTDGNRFCLNLAAVLWLEKADENLHLTPHLILLPPVGLSASKHSTGGAEPGQTPFK